MRRISRLLLWTICAALGAVTAAAQSEATGLTRAQAYARAAQLDALGRALFFDPSLSASGRMACATCHDPQRAFGPPNALPVQLGGKDMLQPGIRAVPSLKYLQAVPQFTEHYYESDDEGDDSIDNGPTGGLTWDGRVDRGRDQARIPLLSPFEMANDDAAAVAAKVRGGYADELRKIFGDAVVDDAEATFAAATEALEVFQQDFGNFYPYSSKYDAYLAGRATLTAQEAHGLALFNDPAKGNCGNCHRSARGKDGTPPQFTDYGLIALGVPRNNNDIPADAEPNYFDLGACGPLRIDLAGRSEYCGRFVTPTLRNVALRRTFFHNGKVHNLRDAITFYVERDTNPVKWYPRDEAGRVRKFDDLPQSYRGNVNMEPPFGGKPGDPPVLSPSEIDNVVAFLNTLTDGYSPER